MAVRPLLSRFFKGKFLSATGRRTYKVSRQFSTTAVLIFDTFIPDCLMNYGGGDARLFIE